MKPGRIATASDSLPYGPLERHCLAWTMFALSAVAFVFVVLRLAPAQTPLAAALFAASIAVAGAAAILAWRNLPGRAGRGGDGLERLIIAAALIYLALICASGDLLPAGDPIAVPQLAQSVASGRLSLADYPPGSSAHAYPPGYPILFAPAMALLPPLQALGLFKALNIVVAALIPAAWAWLQMRLFRPPLPAWAVLGASYFAFIAIERTLPFFLSFGGKCAVFLGLLLAPFAAALSIRFARTWAGVAPAALLFFGLTLIHYTMLHLLAALLAGYAAAGLASGRLRIVEALRLALAGLTTAALMWLLLKEAVSDPRAGATAFDWNTMLAGARQAAASLAVRAPPIVIFMDRDFHIPGSPYRGLLLIACTAVSLVAGRRLGDPGLRDAAVTWFIAFLIGLLFGYGAFPAWITLDFARSFLWAVQAATIATTGVAVLALLLSTPARDNRPGYAAAALVLTAGATLICWDGAVESLLAHRNRLKARDLHQTETLLARARGPGACRLIGESTVAGGGLVVAQNASAWSYAEVLSPCRYLNGSWVQPGAAGGREFDGYPPPRVLRTIDPSETLIFVGRPTAQAAYSAGLRAAGLAVAWTPLGAAARAHAWRMRVS